MGSEMQTDYWWRKKRVKKKDLQKMPNAWLSMQMALKQAQYYLRYTHDDRQSKSYIQIKDETTWLQNCIADLEACMRQHGIGFRKEPHDRRQA